MVAYCFDSNIIIDILQGDSSLKSKIYSLDPVLNEATLTPLTLCELYRGASLHYKSEEKIKEIDIISSSFIILDFTKEACRIYGEDYLYLQKAGTMTQESDLMIASIAKAHGAIVVTRNKKHFEKIKGLKIEEW